MQLIETIIDQATGFSQALAGKLTKDQAILHEIIYQWRKAKGIDKSKGEYWRKAVNCALLLANPTEILPKFEMPPIEYIVEKFEEAKKPKKPVNRRQKIESQSQETQEKQQESDKENQSENQQEND